MNSAVTLTVSEMAQALGLSRDRFYDHVRAGTFPPPVYRLDNRRPVYPPELQELCFRIQRTGVGLHGRPVMFNRHRGRPRRQPSPQPRPRVNQRIKLLCRKLEHLGLVGLTREAVLDALRSCRLEVEALDRNPALLGSLLRYLADHPGAGP